MAEQNILTFEEETHTYKTNGIKVPSVTQILKEAGLIDLSFVDKEILEYKSDLGTKVHTTTELYDQNNLDVDSLHPILKGYLDGWIKFRKDYDFTPTLMEIALIHPLYKYAGKIDRIGTIRKDTVQVDLKSGVHHHSYAIQSAGYTELYNYGKPKKEQIKKRYTVYLKGTGEYEVREHKNPNDTRVFLAALTITNYKRANK